MGHEGTGQPPAQPWEGSELLVGLGVCRRCSARCHPVREGMCPLCRLSPPTRGQHLVWGHFTVLDTARLWLINNRQLSAPPAVPVSPGEVPGISRGAGAPGPRYQHPQHRHCPGAGVVSPAQREGGGLGCQGTTCLDVTRLLGALSGLRKEVLTGGGQTGDQSNQYQGMNARAAWVEEGLRRAGLAALCLMPALCSCPALGEVPSGVFPLFGCFQG